MLERLDLSNALGRSASRLLTRKEGCVSQEYQFTGVVLAYIPRTISLCRPRTVIAVQRLRYGAYRTVCCPSSHGFD